MRDVCFCLFYNSTPQTGGSWRISQGSTCPCLEGGKGATQPQDCTAAGGKNIFNLSELALTSGGARSPSLRTYKNNYPTPLPVSRSKTRFNHNIFHILRLVEPYGGIFCWDPPNTHTHTPPYVCTHRRPMLAQVDWKKKSVPRCSMIQNRQFPTSTWKLENHCCIGYNYAFPLSS